jgi:glycosyltransferase involved in cell wall biosynthesis
VRAVWLGEGGTVAPPPGTPYWLGKRLASGSIRDAVARAIRDRPADVVVTQLHASPGAVEAAGETPTVLLLPSYESLCKYAFDAGTACDPASCGERCPAVLALPEPERREQRRSRDAHRRALAAATGLVAPSEFVADACERWCGRRPAVVPWVSAPTTATRDPAPDGRLVLAAATWSVNKGVDLLEPLADGLPDRRFLVTEHGLPAALRDRLGRRPNIDLSPALTAAELLAGAAVALVPSQWPEPFGRIAFEAIAAGVPCVASDVGGLREVVPAPELVRPDAPEPWIAAVRRLRDEPAWRAAQARARERAAAILAREPLRRLEELVLAVAR